MASISTAIPLNHISATVGYEIKRILDGIKAGNLPQRIPIFAEVNTANQVGLPTSLDFTTAKEVADIAGYGSPAYHIARILRPISGDLLGGIPTVLYPVLEAAGGVASVRTTTVTGTATKTVTHKLVIAGRDQIDGRSYSYVVEKGDSAAEIVPKMLTAVAAVLGCPGIPTNVTDTLVLTAKWVGVTSDEMGVTIDLQGEASGLTYAVVETTAGAGVPEIADNLTALGSEWSTLLINGIGKDSTILDALEAYNGNPNDANGRYLPTEFKPLIAYVGEKDSTVSALTATWDARKTEVTNKAAIAANSPAFSFEAPANNVLLYAKLVQDTPQSDPINFIYPDMPAAEDIGDFADPVKREQIINIGCSNVKLNNKKYQILDDVVTYHPDDEPSTQTFFRYVRDLVGVDWNIKYGYALLEAIHVTGKTIIADGSTSSAANTISPSRWQGILYGFADDLEARALIASAAFMKTSLQVQQGETNKDRFETNFRIQRTGTARVSSTTNEISFNFGG